MLATTHQPRRLSASLARTAATVTTLAQPAFEWPLAPPAEPSTRCALPVRPAGVRHLFVHEFEWFQSVPGDRERWFRGRATMPERALVLAEPEDVVCLAEPIEPAYLDYLSSLGLAFPADRIVVVPAGPRDLLVDALAASPAHLAQVAALLGDGPARLDPVIASRREFRLADALRRVRSAPLEVVGGNVAVVDVASRKEAMRDVARDLGLPVARGEVVALDLSSGRRNPEPLRAAIARGTSRFGSVLVRGSDGAGGSSTFVVGPGGLSPEQVCTEVAGRGEAAVYLVEELLPVTLSPNVLLWVEPGTGAATLVSVTDQVWGGPLVHFGNRLPSAAATVEAMIDASFRFAAWLTNAGYSGWLGFDFVEYRAGGELRWAFAEVNPRANGSTYPVVLLQRLAAAAEASGLPAPRALATNRCPAQARSFAALCDRLGDLLYDPSRGSGVVPYAPGSLREGVFRHAAFAATPEQADELLSRIEP